MPCYVYPSLALAGCRALRSGLIRFAAVPAALVEDPAGDLYAKRVSDDRHREARCRDVDLRAMALEPPVLARGVGAEHDLGAVGPPYGERVRLARVEVRDVDGAVEQAGPIGV